MALSKNINAYSSHYRAIWDAALNSPTGITLRYPTKPAAQRERMWLYGFKEAAQGTDIPRAKFYPTFQILLRESPLTSEWLLKLIPRRMHEDVDAARASLATIGIDLDQAMCEIEMEGITGKAATTQLSKNPTEDGLQIGSGKLF